MADNGITAEELASWMTPREALMLVDKQVGNKTGSAKAIIGRLKGGKIKSAAASRSEEVKGRAQSMTNLCRIPTGHWIAWQESGLCDLWGVGDIRVHIFTHLFANPPVICYFGIRFDPDDVRRIVPQPMTIAAITANSRETIEDVPSNGAGSKGPPVSEAHLKAWFEVYQQAYTGAADTLERALESARGMFPGKFVSRDRVRDLCGGRKPGPKKTPKP